MEKKAVQKRFLPLVKRLAALFVIYFFLVIPLSAYLLSEDFYPAIGMFPALLLVNILFISPMMLFISSDEALIFLSALCRWIDTLNRWVGHGVAYVTSLLIIVVFMDVVMRYAFSTSFVFIQELEWHLFAFIFLMGAGYTLSKDGHVRVDIIYQRMDPKAQAWINFIGVLVFLLPGCYMVIVTSVNFVYNSWTVLEGSPDPGGIPYRFILKSAIPLGFILIMLQGISLSIRSLFTIMGKDIDADGKGYHLERDCRS